jgi:Mor family transcriptional regulator
MAELNAQGTTNSAAAAQDGPAMVVDTVFDQADPDLVDAIFAYILREFPEMEEKVCELKDATRKEFGGDRSYVPRRSPAARQKLVRDVLELFNGRNATEIARSLNIGRATVYRIVKTEGAKI